jgi:hypothetical protein
MNKIFKRAAVLRSVCALLLFAGGLVTRAQSPVTPISSDPDPITMTGTSCVGNAVQQLLSTGTIQIQIVDGNGVPTPLATGTNLQVITSTFSEPVTSGSFTSILIPNPANTTLSPYYLHMSVLDKVTNKITNYPKLQVMLNDVPVSGRFTQFNFCKANTTQAFGAVPATYITGPTGPMGPSGIGVDAACFTSGTGKLTCGQVNATVSPATTDPLQTIITNAGSTSDVGLSCGTYNVGSGLTLANNKVHIHSQNRCATINFTSSAGLNITGTDNVIDGVTFTGATNNYTVKIAATAHGTHFQDNKVTGGGSAGGASTQSAAIWVEAPNQDVWIERNEFTGNGTSGGLGYTVLTDGGAGGYVKNTHIRNNWIHDNTSPDAVYGFDLGDGSEISWNTINQGNLCGGALCNNPAGNGVGYSIMAYSEAYACATLASQFTCNVYLNRTGNVVTSVMGGMLGTWPLNIGDLMFLETAQLGVNGTDFNGVFALTGFGTSITGGTGYTTASGLATTGGTGTGATVNITASSGHILTSVIAAAGTGYTFGDKLTIVQGGGSGGYAIVAKVTAGAVNAIANYGMTWAQTAPNDNDDHVPGDAGINLPPLPNVKIQNNTVTNSSGACIYTQGMSNMSVTGNILTQCDLQSQAGGHPQSAIGLNGNWGGTVVGNSIDGVGLTHGIAADNAYFTTISGNNISNIAAGYGIQLYDSWHLAVDGNAIGNAQRGGIGGDANTQPNCAWCSFSGNTIRMLSNGSGFSFAGQDYSNSITGGSIHAPSTGLSNSGITLGSATSKNTVSGVTVNCQPDGQTGASSSTSTYGIRSSASASQNVISGNTILGCNASGGAGILDQGNDDLLIDNKITGSATGILASVGTNPLVVGNVLWGNTTPTSITSTGAVILGNQTTQGGTPVYIAASTVISPVASIDLATQAASIGTTTLYAVTATGWYQMICYTVVTQAATTSSTLPPCIMRWSDGDTSTANAITMGAGAGTGNTVGLTNLSVVGASGMWVWAKTGTNISYSTGTYATSGATPMQFALHAKVIH